MRHSSVSSLNKLIESTAKRSFPATVIVTVQPGDTLSRIIRDHYHIARSHNRYPIAEASIMRFNAKITDPNHIRSGTSLRLMPLPREVDLRYGPASVEYAQMNRSLNKPTFLPTGSRQEALPSHPSARLRDRMPKNRDEQTAYYVLASLQEKYNIFGVSAGAGVGAFGNIVGRGNDEIIRKISAVYEEFKNNEITKGQYDYRRKVILEDLKKRIGPLDKLLFNGKTARQGLRINRGLKMPATQGIHQYANKLTRLSGLAKGGNVILAGVGVTMACKAIGDTDDRQEKNEILVETTISTIAGVASGFAIGVFLVSNPAGWAVAITLGVGAAVGSAGLGEVAKRVYNKSFKEHDLVEMTNVDQLCD